MRRLLFAVALLAAACTPTPAPVDPLTVHFEIDMASALKAGWLEAADRVGVRGGIEPLSWNETIYLEDPDGNGVFEGDVVFAPAADSIIPYKVKVDGDGNPNDGWEVGENRSFIRTSQPRVKRAFEDTTEPLPATITGDVRIHESFGSGLLVAPRHLAVYLPPGYETETDRRYPVLYMHDGQNVFDVRGAGAEWRFDEAAEDLIRADQIAPVIIVGVYNTPARMDEYTPAAMIAPAGMGGGSREPVGGKGRDYATFLVDEVKAFVDATYRTQPGFESTSLGGSSLGGLITMSIGTWYPKVFSGLLVVSPSVWWGEGAILKMVEEGPAADGRRVWLDMGTREGSRGVESAEALRDALASRGFALGKDLRFVIDEGAEHNEAAWAGRGPDMLRFLYGR